MRIVITLLTGLSLGFFAQDGTVGRGDPHEYEYKQQTWRWVMMIQAGDSIIGHLDQHGDFIPEAKLSLVPVINKPAKPNEPVYEYRSGHLIRGTLDKDGSFVPQLGSAITPFKDYRYAADSPRIYNLPGTFVKKAKKKADK